MVSQWVTILELDDCIVERRATIELKKTRRVAQDLVAIAAGTRQRDLIGRTGKMQRAPGGVIDRADMQWLVHGVGNAYGRSRRAPARSGRCNGPDTALRIWTLHYDNQRRRCSDEQRQCRPAARGSPRA